MKIIFKKIFYMETRNLNLYHNQRAYREISDSLAVSPCKLPFPAPLYLIIPGPHAELTLALLLRQPLPQESLFAISPMIYILLMIFSITHMGPQLSSP